MPQSDDASGPGPANRSDRLREFEHVQRLRMELAFGGLRSLTLVSSGAIVAILGFADSVPNVDMLGLRWAMGFFVGGIASATGTYVLGCLNMMFISDHIRLYLPVEGS